MTAQIKRWIPLAAVLVFSVILSQIAIPKVTILTLAVIGLFAYVSYIHSEISGEASGLKPSRQFLHKLLETEPIDPVHERPNRFTRHDWGVTDGDIAFFRDFMPFGDVMNNFFGRHPNSPEKGHWRLQGLAKVDMGDDDGPSYGRNYKIFFNQVEVGRLGIRAGLLKKYTSDTPNVSANLELWLYPRYIPFKYIYELFHTIIMWLTDDSHDQMMNNSLYMHLAIIWTIWDTKSDTDAPVELRFDGTARNFLAHARASGRQH
jgi:hypothetical protein